MDDLISRQRLLKELKHHKELFCRNRIQFLGLSKNDKARVDEIDNCIATVINMPSAQPEIEERKEESAQNVPKEDLISRNAAIDAMSESLKRVFPEHRQIAEKCLKALPSAQPEPQWIPVSERLPESKPEDLEYPTVIACCEDGEVMTACYYESTKEWGIGENYDRKINPVAWMPLPEPYRAERRTDDLQ